MVKADIKRDYYADLGLDQKAEDDEIRKKYRKLALKCHPDRNPGKELEFNAKFQAIQAAYEILIDPKERLKYDTGRLRAGYGRFYAPPRPSAPVPKPQYPPPPNAAQPRRAPNPAAQPRPAPNPTTQPRRAPTPGTQPRRPSEPNAQHPQGFPTPGSYPTPPSTGSQKYASYAKAGSQKWDKIYEDSRTRADAFRAFQEMKNTNTGGWSGFNPKTGQSNQSPMPDNPSASNPQSQRPRSAYEAFFASPKPGYPGPQRAQTTKKKQGFAPGTPGGDEPMAQNTSAYASTNRARFGTPYPQPHFEPAPSPTAKKWSTQEEVPDTSVPPNLHRTSSKYASTGGEKTYISSAGIGRSTGARHSPFADSDSRPRTNPPSPTSPQYTRHHSASPKLKPNRDRTFSSSPESTDSEDVPLNSRPKKTPRSRKFATNAANDFFGRQNTDSSGENIPEWAARTDSWLFGESHTRQDGNPNSKPRRKWNSDTDNVQPEAFHSDNSGFNQRPSHGPVPPAPQPSQQSQATNFQPHRGPEKFQNSKESGKPDAINNMYASSRNKSSAREWSQIWGFTSSAPINTPEHSLPLWAYPSSILPQFSKSSQRDNETGGPNAMPPHADKSSRDSPKPLINTNYPTQADQTRMNADPVSTPSFGPFANVSLGNKPNKSRSHESIDVTFSASDWDGKFQHATDFFAPKLSREPRPSQQKSSRPRGRSISRPNSATHPRPHPQPGVGKNQNQSTAPAQEPTNNTSGPSTGVMGTKFSEDKWSDVLNTNIWTMPHNEISNPNPMRQKSPRKPQKSAVKRPTIPKPATVTTEAEEAKAEASASTETLDSSNRGFTGVEEMDIDEGVPAAKAPKPPTPVTTGLTGTTTGAAATVEPSKPKPKQKPDTQPSALNLKNLTNVAPFTATNSTGINDLNDLTTTLPFESRPDNTIRTRLPVRPQDLPLPKPPKAPTAPNFASQLTKPQIQTMWERYVAEMNAYMHEWHTFNSKMIGHFNARQETVLTGLAPNWVSAVGDSTRLRIDGDLDSSPQGSGALKSTENHEDGEQLVAGSGKGGFNAYLRGVQEDFIVREHWEVAWEKHLTCLEGLDRTKRWLRGVGKSSGGS
ncbi:hypothetical protein FQN53_007366 [Emmonsiellopsis sp. PD_33]|nr:hypothetical protein FQN53_007366 [Emmonsiellopsis sp. PD_33]